MNAAERHNMSNTELIAEARSSGEQWRYGAVPEMVLSLADALEAAEQALVERTQQRDELFDLADKHLTERDTLIERIAAAKVRLREIGATDTTVYDILTNPVQP